MKARTAGECAAAAEFSSLWTRPLMISFAHSDPQQEISTDSGSLAQVLREARYGCPAARGALCETFRPFVIRLARRMIPARLQAKVDPEDLAQDVLLDLHRSIGRFTGQEDAQIRGWLCRATTNRGRDLLRKFGPGTKRDVSRELLLTSWEDGDNLLLARPARRSECPYEQAVQAELRRAIRAAIEQLPQDQRRALELAFEEHCSYTEAARELGRSSEAVRKLCTRARKQLKRELRASACAD